MLLRCTRSLPNKMKIMSKNVALLLHSIYATFMSRKPKTDEEIVLNRLEEARADAHLSRQELADLVVVHYQTIGYIERGEYSPSLVLALKIAEELKVSIEHLFWLEKEKVNE